MNEELVRYIIESNNAVNERHVSRLWKLCIIIFLAFIVSNGLWLFYEYQWRTVDTTITEQTVDQSSDYGNNDNTFIGGDNGIETTR